MKLIIASHNKGKIPEYKDISAPLGFLALSQGEEKTTASMLLAFQETYSHRTKAFRGSLSCLQARQLPVAEVKP